MYTITYFSNDERQTTNDERRVTSHNGLPRHIAIIMDGNGRWAKRRGLPRVMGHQAGIRSVREVITKCRMLGIQFLTLYAFSAENWKRPKPEVDRLMDFLVTYLIKERDEMNTHNIRFMAIGRLADLPKRVTQEIARTVGSTHKNTGLVLNLALNYGGRSEIVDAARRISQDIKKGRFAPDELDEEKFKEYLYTAGLPDPDLLIRTSGEQRLSNFLLWQVSYTELYVTETRWPDFREKNLMQAIDAYRMRQRRFGGVN